MFAYMFLQTLKPFYPIDPDTFSAQFNLKPDNDTSGCIRYLRGDDPVVSKALRDVVAKLGKSVGYVNRPGLALMGGVEALREG